MPAESYLWKGLVLTSIDVEKVKSKTGEERSVRFNGSISGKADDETAIYLHKVRVSKEKDSKGKFWLEAETLTVKEAQGMMHASSDTGSGKPLFSIHGFNVHPKEHLEYLNTQCKEKFNKGKFTLVPVLWPSRGGIRNYDKDRKNNAVGAAKAFKTLKSGVHGLSESRSLLCHSMGNRILGAAADEKFKFDNIFMAAADVRYDLFRGCEEGLRICSMLNKEGKIHVLHNVDDSALIWAGRDCCTYYTRLGRGGNDRNRNCCGCWSTVEKTDPKIKGKIVNLDCNSLLSKKEKSTHHYQFKDFAVKYYQSQ